MFCITLIQYYLLFIDTKYMKMNVSNLIKSTMEAIPNHRRIIQPTIYEPNYFFYTMRCLQIILLCIIQLLLIWLYCVKVPNYILIQIWLTIEFGANIIKSIIEILIKNTMVFCDYYQFHFYFHVWKNGIRIERIEFVLEGNFPIHYFTIQEGQYFNQLSLLKTVMIVRFLIRLLGIFVLFLIAIFVRFVS